MLFALTFCVPLYVHSQLCSNNLQNMVHHNYPCTVLIHTGKGGRGGRCTSEKVRGREEIFMEWPKEPNMEPSLAYVLLCTYESTNAGFPL